MDIKKANTSFKVEDLFNGRLDKNQFQVDYLPMWQFLDNMERKAGGFQNTEMKTIFEAIYEFALISVSLDKADTTARIDALNEQNLKWFTKAQNLEQELEVLKQRLQENPSINIDC